MVEGGVVNAPTIRDLARAELAALKAKPAPSEVDRDLRQIVHLLAGLLETARRRR